jgi:dolichyl-phosphate beta-glucosyltransferase
MRLSVVIPAYQEVQAIAATVGRVRAELAIVDDDGGVEVVVVDDGSGDGTAAAARRGGADQVLALPVNRGKGAAVRAGVLAAGGDAVVFTDADLSYAPSHILRVLEAIEGGADMVLGDRFHPESTTLVEAGVLRRLGGRAINLATRAVLHGTYPDTQCGLKGFWGPAGRVLFGHSRIDGFAFDVEIIHLAERYGVHIERVPVAVRNSDRSTVHVARDALELVVDLGRIHRAGAVGRYELAPAERSMLAAGRSGRAR